LTFLKAKLLRAKLVTFELYLNGRKRDSFKDLDHCYQVDIFKLILTTFETSFVFFEAAGAVAKLAGA
jgi:hypothetical protein